MATKPPLELVKPVKFKAVIDLLPATFWPLMVAVPPVAVKVSPFTPSMAVICAAVTVLKPSLGYKQCAEIAREGYETGKSLHDIVVKERKLLTQEKWDEVFSFENLISPKFEQ